MKNRPGAHMRSLAPACNFSRLRGRKRRGAGVVEFAIIAPLLFMLLFGIFEFGRMVMVQQILTNASREGARRAILENTSDSEVQQVVIDYLANADISSATVEVTPTNLTTIGFGDPVNVRVSVSFDQVSWIPSPWFLKGTMLSGESTMRGERPE